MRDGLESGPLSHLVSFDVGRALGAVHVAAILFYLCYDRNDLTSPMLSGRRRVAGEQPKESDGLRAAPVWRLWTGVALATLVVWIIIRG